MIYYPYWAQLNFLAACVVTAWILVPIGFINGIWGSDKYPIQTQTLYLRNGSRAAGAQTSTLNTAVSSAATTVYH